MIREENMNIHEVSYVTPGSTKETIHFKLIIDAEDKDHAELLKKGILFDQRVEADLEDYLRLLSEDDQHRTQEQVQTDLSKLLENEFFEEPRDPDEDNY